LAEKAGAVVLHHVINLGKGAALKTGCDYAFSRGATHIVALDADAQHNPDDIPRFAEKSAENIVKSIAKKKEILLARLIYALGIKNVGQETAVDLARHFGSLEKLRQAKLEDFDSISNIGPVVAKSIYQWFNEKDNQSFLDRLMKTGVIIKKSVDTALGRLSGKIFVLTGSLGAIDRNLAKEKIRDLGGQVSESVSAKVNFVVAGKEAGSKLDRARKLGIKIINEKTFLKML